MRYSILLVLLLCSNILCAQERHWMGCVYNPEADGKAALAAPLIRGDYENLPIRYSLKQYCPYAKSQGQHGTCTSWATVYAARTICEAINNNWTEREKITEEAFSPIFVYKQLNDTSVNCESGIGIRDALEFLKKNGVPKFNSFNVKCADFIPKVLFDEALYYKIDEYHKLFMDTYIATENKSKPLRENWAWDTPHQTKIYTIKKSLSEKHPVVISIDSYTSFHYDDQIVWNGIQDSLRDGHALCVVGYDDDKYGGAFEIMNSWGTYWGNDGFMWIRYDDFCNNVKYAYDVYVKKKETPLTISRKEYTLGGELEIKLKDHIEGKLNPTIKKEDGVLFYTLNHTMQSGEGFRIYITNNEPAYVYAISSDMENNVNQNFPPIGENISPALTYKSSHIAIPNEDYYQELGDVKGKDFMCVLYSIEELEIDSILEQIKKGDGTFYQRVIRALGNKVVPQEDIQFYSKRMSFSAQTNRTVIPLFMEWSHE